MMVETHLFFSHLEAMNITAKWAVIALLFTPLMSACGDDGSNKSLRVNNYLQSDAFSRLVLEVDYVDGYAPMDEAQAGMIAKVSPLVDKPDGVAAMADETIASRGADHAWTFAELDDLADQTNNLSVGDNTVKMHVLFVDGHYEQDSNDGKVLGLAWDSKNIAIFKKTIQDNCQGVLAGDQLCRFAEQAIWTHEVGHVLGLVNNGVPTQANHQDKEHGHHCTNDECVMFWAYEGTKLFDVLGDRLGGDGGALEFDQDCKDDLASVREE
jgi:hypothetical protein